MQKTIPGLAILAAFALTGCGGSDKVTDEEAADALFGDMPKCSEVWKVGKTLDLDTYEGCEKDSDTIEGAMIIGCSAVESNSYTSFDDRLWVVQTGVEDNEGGTPGRITDVDPKC